MPKLNNSTDKETHAVGEGDDDKIPDFIDYGQK